MRASVAPGTVATRLRNLRALMRHAGVTDPLQLTRADVVAWLGRPLKAWTRVGYYATAAQFAGFLRDFGHDPGSNLVTGIPAPRPPRPVARPIDDPTVDRLLTMPLDMPAYAYVRLGLFAALRVHEIAKVRGDDLDLEAGWLRVVGKGNDEQLVPIHPVIVQLAAMMPPDGLWFPSPEDPRRPVRAATVSRVIRHALRKVGSQATPHALRHTAATRMQRTTRDVRLTQALLRHRAIASTMIYTEASNAELQQAVQSLDWGDVEAPVWGLAPPEPAPPVIDVAGLDTEQLRDLTGQLLAALAQRTD